jgi:phenylacetate-CoA ligase
LKINNKIKDTVKYAFLNSNFYKNHFKSIENNISELDDFSFRQLPFTFKEDIAKNNESFCCVERNEIAEYVTTSGTQGNPITIYLTHSDLERLAENERASLKLMDGSSNDLYQLMTTIDKQFMAGLAYYTGALKLGAGIIRLGPGSILEQWKSILTYKPTKLIAVPSYISRLISFAEQNNIDFKKCSIDSIICIGEPIRNNDFTFNSIGKSIVEKWDVRLFSTYASTEMATAFSECKFGIGGHFNNELIHCEVLNKDNQQVKNGESGEIVITTINVEGTPLIRYKTGDIATYWDKPCNCGNSNPRLGPILGRKNQLIKFKGTTLYPQSIFNVIKSIDHALSFFIEIYQDEITAKRVIVNLAEEETKHLIVESIIEAFQSTLKVKLEINFLPLKAIQKTIFQRDKRKPQLIKYHSV